MRQQRNGWEQTSRPAAELELGEEAGKPSSILPSTSSMFVAWGDDAYCDFLHKLFKGWLDWQRAGREEHA